MSPHHVRLDYLHHPGTQANEPRRRCLEQTLARMIDMKVRLGIGEASCLEWLNFLVTNRIPRKLATRFMGWFSRIENPLVRSASITTWKLFADDLRLHEASKTRFKSLHDCFTRKLRPGARNVDRDPNVITSPCDAIVGAHGNLRGTQVLQAKGAPYALEDLLHDPGLVERYRDGVYVTLRLKSSMYHRFHAPFDCGLGRVTYLSGDTWNVNPPTLKRIERLFCKNERAVLDLDIPSRLFHLTLVPVAAILVASIKLHCLDETLSLAYDGPQAIPVSAQYTKGAEMGYFHHGSTIILFGSRGLHFADGIQEGDVMRMGAPLLRHTGTTHQ